MPFSGGLLLLATLNRTLKSFALAIVGAEYVLRWLPPGTHTWSKFVTPKELTRAIETTGLEVATACGMVTLSIPTPNTLTSFRVTNITPVYRL